MRIFNSIAGLVHAIGVVAATLLGVYKIAGLIIGGLA